MKCEIREMRKDEWKRVLRLIQMHDTHDARYAKRYYRDYFRRYGQGWDKILVAEVAKRIAGVSGYFYDNKEAQGIYWLGFTYVHPAFQGRRVGQQLLSYIVDDLKRRNARKLFAATSSHAIYDGAVSFYTSHGFHLEGALKDLYGPGEDQIIMGKDLRKQRRRRIKTRRRKKKVRRKARRRYGRKRHRRQRARRRVRKSIRRVAKRGRKSIRKRRLRFRRKVRRRRVRVRRKRKARRGGRKRR